MGNVSEISKDFILNINTDKICYFPGETIYGTIHLQAKPGFKHSELKYPLAFVKLIEYHYYTYSEKIDEEDSKTVEEKIENKLFQSSMFFKEYQGANLLQGVELPFSFKIQDCHPTCNFNMLSYVEHILSVEFQSLGAKKDEYIIIKNPQIFTESSNLYKSPVIEQLKKKSIN